MLYRIALLTAALATANAAATWTLGGYTTSLLCSDAANLASLQAVIVVGAPTAKVADFSSAGKVLTYSGDVDVSGVDTSVVKTTMGLLCAGLTITYGSGTGGGAAAPCFPSSAIVTMADGKKKRIDSLKENDEVLAATLDGGLTTDKVSFLSIADPSAEHKLFLSVQTDAKASLNLTTQHHVPVGDVCCSNIIQAKDLKIGTKMWMLSPGSPLPVSTKVTGMIVHGANGLHSPVLAKGGLPIVDGFVTSFDSYKVVSAAATAFPSMIKFCKATGTCSLMEKVFASKDMKHVVEA